MRKVAQWKYYLIRGLWFTGLSLSEDTTLAFNEGCIKLSVIQDKAFRTGDQSKQSTGRQLLFAALCCSKIFLPNEKSQVVQWLSCYSVDCRRNGLQTESTPELSCLYA